MPIPETLVRRTTADGCTVLVLATGDVTDRLCRTFTRHRPLSVADALAVAGEVCLFDAAELPSLLAAARRLSPRSPRGILPGELRALASELSHKAGTRPADVALPRPRPLSKTALAAFRRRDGGRVEHARRGCRRLFCSVCG